MQTKIPFHRPNITGAEKGLVSQVIDQQALGTGGQYSNSCEQRLQKITQAQSTLLTSSCTHALEMSALLADIQPGDEVIMPSFTFVSAANAFVLRGAKIIFVDIQPDTMNIDPECIVPAITAKTKALLIMHYGGHACDMDRIMSIVNEHNLFLIEDAAHCIGAFYKGQHLGTFGQLGTLSFHYTKNIHCGEGGALLVNDSSLIEKAAIIREKGTNRKQFFEGKVDKYSWVSVGSSYLMSEMNAAFLFCQLEKIEACNVERNKIIDDYNTHLQDTDFFYKQPLTSADTISNGHLYFIKVKDVHQRANLIQYLSNHGIKTAFHYVPLHSSIAGKKYGEFSGADIHTTVESSKLLRLPLFNGLKDIHPIVEALHNFRPV